MQRTGVAVLDKTMAILRAYRRGDTVLQPQGVAERTGLSLPTVYRLMQAMTEHGLLEKESTAYRPGMALLHLGGLAANSLELRRVLLPRLQWLNAQTGENAEMHVRRAGARIAVEVVLSSQNLRPFVEIGAALPLHVGASGKALLAWLPDGEAEQVAQASWARFGGTPSLDVGALQSALSRVRKRGWSGSDGERSRGVAAVAAPVFDASGQVAATVVLSGPSVRLPAKTRRSLAPLVCRAASEASTGAGYSGQLPFQRTESGH
jgi:IclR family acetate operon transcriptional repressor